ncbi:DNA mismatch endonuclease Vsr [Tropicimonas sp. TH_r6]|uniref:very short patch repair endonuclease n=1 Tax=Tropicimonas sp. TH_r6 TaxID=3082085 RepID=UPI002952EE5C|nr:DNA mismatch endonuclease Vsr [Tropicimonas sp. TH_r6]MDV7141763.1 DNA mismatch endonuclease Vsr [Tropicimonas sp. TH_r6]
MSRSEMMSRIGPKDTKPELVVRRALHACGYRFRLHKKELPGKPDLVLSRFQSAIFVHGCYWHAHEGCRYFRLPKTRREFWEEKLLSNRKRDRAAIHSLLDSGWRVLVIWECATRELRVEQLVARIIDWLQSPEKFAEISSDKRQPTSSTPKRNTDKGV